MSLTDGSFIRNYKTVSNGVELTSDQINRLTRFFEAASAEGLPEFQYMLLAFEYYLATGESRIRDALQASAEMKDLIEKHGVLENSSEFLKRAKEIEQSSIEMSKNMGPALEAVKQVESSVKRSGNIMGDLERVVNSFSSSCEETKKTLLDDLSKKMEESVKKQIETVADKVKERIKEKEKNFQWSETCGKSTFFLTIFTVFATSFFFMGLMSHESGFPAWIVIPSGNANPIYWLFTLVFGLPMSWVVFIGGAFLSAIWLYEARKSKSESPFVEFVQDHWWQFLFAFLGLIVTYRLYNWFF